MHSVKPGRGPSILSALGAIGVVIIALTWGFNFGDMIPGGATFMVVFIGMGIAIAIYHIYNATQRHRMSMLDITHDGEEGDPVSRALGHRRRHRKRRRARSRHRGSDHLEIGARDERGESAKPAERSDSETRRFDGGFCPFCGTSVQKDFDFCPSCGKDI